MPIEKLLRPAPRVAEDMCAAEEVNFAGIESQLIVLALFDQRVEQLQRLAERHVGIVCPMQDQQRATLPSRRLKHLDV